MASASSIELLSRSTPPINNIPWSNVLTVFINGNQIQLVNPDPTELLVTFIRDKAGLKGTKLGCEEGGCGACTVVLTKKQGIVSVNSCLRPLCANDGMAITTVEGIGSVKSGLSDEQKSIVSNNGTQCGFCTPGWVTNMHALNESSAATNSPLSKLDIEKYLDGNICRCTGYKPIVTAFHSFSTDQKQSHDCDGVCSPTKPACISHGCVNESGDLEDTLCGSHSHSHAPSGCGVGSKSKPLGSKRLRERDMSLVRAFTPQPLMFFNPATGKRWIRPVGLDQLCAVLAEYSFANNTHGRNVIQLVGGNTSIGVTKYMNGSAPYNSPDDYNVFVDVNCVSIMTASMFDAPSGELTVGAATSIHDMISLLNKHATPSVTPHVDDNNPRSIFSVTANHLLRIANSQVRHAASWAGNLMVYLHYMTSFPSDAVLALTTAGVKLQLSNLSGEIVIVDMGTFLTYSYEGFVAAGLFIVSLVITETNLQPRVAGSILPRETVSQTFKIAQRAANAHAHVNAGFQFQLLKQGPAATVPVCLSARIVYGGVSQSIFLATRTMQVLQNAAITSATLQTALTALQQDLLAAGPSSSYGDQEFRESVMQGALYRAFLSCYSVFNLPHNLASAVLPWVRPVTRGTEIYQPTSDTDPSSDAPVGRPVRKLEAPIQATGEAVYPSDEQMSAQGLHGSLVYATQCAVILTAIDTSAARSVPGVIAVYTAVDVPGANTIGGGIFLYVPVGQVVQCIGAPLAVVVATSEAIANQASALVRVTYQGTSAVPIVNLSQAIQQQSFFSDVPESVSYLLKGDPSAALSGSYRTVSGHIAAGGQYHFAMEAQAAVATVSDGDNIDVVCGTQDPSGNQAAIANMLSVPQNKVIVKCTRTGGAFGGKFTGGLSVSLSAALVASKLSRSVRIFNSRTAEMSMQGGREGWAVDYVVGFAADGAISAIKYDFYVDAGISSSDTIGSLSMGVTWSDNAYFVPNIEINAKVCFTNTPARTSMRAPGVVQSCLATEMVIERIAVELGLSTTSVQQRNFIRDGETTITGQPIKDCTMPTIWSTLLTRSHFEERFARCTDFNKNSLWRKRGIAVSPVKYGMGWSYYGAGVRVGVRAADGTVTVAHNGIEMGQGINTKVAQAVAMSLGVDVGLVRVTATATDKVVNGGPTGGSGTSEVVVQAALNACAALNDRLDPFRPSTKTVQLTNKRRYAKSTDTASWVELLSSLPCDVSLNVEGWFSPPENPNGQAFQYFVYAAAVTEIELDVLSGAVHVLASEIVYDCGQSLNPAVDCGQIEGALVMGLGYFLTEKVEYAPSGLLQTAGTWEYKPPMVQDIPSVLMLTLLKNAYNPDGILGSKAVGEPPMVTASSIYFALKMAIQSARGDAGVSGHFDLEVPSTVDLRQKACLVSANRFVMPC
eukprot:gene24084-30387_t